MSHTQASYFLNASRVPFQRRESSPSGQGMTGQGTFSDNFG